MTPNHTASLIIGAVLILTLAVFWVGGVVVLGQDRALHFETYDAMASEGLIDQGTVPKHIPKNATQVRVFKDSTTNSVELKFRYRKEQILGIEDECTPAIKRNRSNFYLCGWPYDTLVILHDDGVGELTTLDTRIELAQQVLNL